MIYRTRSEIVKNAEYFADLHSGGYKKRLYYCKAQIIYPVFSDFIILQSYSTIVAAYQRTAGILWVFGHYSTTTAQHVAKFMNWIIYEYHDSLYYPRKVNLYNDSKTGKRAAHKNLDDDFASVIESALSQQ